MMGNVKCKNFHFEPPFGHLGVTYKVHLWLAGKRVVDFLLEIIELFSLALTVEALWADIGRNFGLWKGVGHFERKFQGKGGSTGSSTNEFWRQQARLPGLSRGVVCVILCLAVLIQYRCVTHSQTDTRTRDDGRYPRRAMLRAGKNEPLFIFWMSQK